MYTVMHTLMLLSYVISTYYICAVWLAGRVRVVPRPLLRVQNKYVTYNEKNKLLKCQNHSGTDQNTLLLFEGNSVLGYMKPLDQVLSIIEIRVDSFLILHMAATGPNDCWQVIQVDQGAGPVTLAVDNHGRIWQAPGVPMQALYTDKR